MGIDFSPTVAELEATRSALREKMYQDVKKEIDRLNQTYLNQSYQLHTLNVSLSGGPVVRPMMMKAAAAEVAAPNAEPATFSVSNKVVLTADISIAAERVLQTKK